MDSESPAAAQVNVTDSLDEYDIDASSSIDDGTLPYDRYLDRELSWLAFNQRVLELAEDLDLPLLERANFLAIFATNLDEFFMVRVAGLKRRIDTGLAVPTNVGRAPLDVLNDISERAHELQERHARVFRTLVKPALDEADIHIEGWADLDEADRERMQEVFQNQIFPVLMPLAVDPAHPFPYISGLSLNLSIRVRNPKTDKVEFARLKVPQNLPRFVQLPNTGALRYIPLEDLLSNPLAASFPGMQALEKELLRRRFGSPIRLEISDDMDDVTLGLLMQELRITDREVYRLPAP